MPLRPADELPNKRQRVDTRRDEETPSSRGVSDSVPSGRTSSSEERASGDPSPEGQVQPKKDSSKSETAVPPHITGPLPAKASLFAANLAACTAPGRGLSVRALIERGVSPQLALALTSGAGLKRIPTDPFGRSKPGFVSHSSSFRGVYSRGGKWNAQIQHGGKKVYLGTFPLEQEAALAYDRAAVALHGPRAVTTFPISILKELSLMNDEDAINEDAGTPLPTPQAPSPMVAPIPAPAPVSPYSQVQGPPVSGPFARAPPAGMPVSPQYGYPAMSPISLSVAPQLFPGSSQGGPMPGVMAAGPAPAFATYQTSPGVSSTGMVTFSRDLAVHDMSEQSPAMAYPAASRRAPMAAGRDFLSRREMYRRYDPKQRVWMESIVVALCIPNGVDTLHSIHPSDFYVNTIPEGHTLLTWYPHQILRYCLQEDKDGYAGDTGDVRSILPPNDPQWEERPTVHPICNTRHGAITCIQLR